jgi:hypothetical protein
MQDEILNLAYEVSRVTKEKIDLIDSVMRQTNLLAINARIEAARAGTSGSAFSVVAQEMGAVASDISRLSKELRGAISDNIEQLEKAGAGVVQQFRGARYSDLALNAIEIIDRNLYERSCDVRWWATDSAVVDAVEKSSAETCRQASSRLETILRSYTVYIDLWVADASGRVVATGRPSRYPKAQGLDVSRTEWFRKAMATRTGDDFVVTDIETSAPLDQAAVATYATAIRRGGNTDGKPIGALGIFFDWAPQAASVVKGVGLTDEEWGNCRVMLVDANHRIIASSDGVGVLRDQFHIRIEERERGFVEEGDRLVAYALTPGYETYPGLGWYGVIESRASGREGIRAAPVKAVA